MKQISTCLWFDDQAEEAVKFYSNLFKTKTHRTTHYSKSSSAASGRQIGSVMTVDFELENIKVVALNGGPLFKFSQSLSFFVSCSSVEEIKTLWAQLNDQGKTHMGLDHYPWAELYGWTADRFGVEWQLILSPREQKITPSFLFTDALFGKGQRAVDFYTGLFPNSKIGMTAKDEKTGALMHCSFTLNGQSFTLMEGQGEHGLSFNESMSLVVTCESQEEIDTYWNGLIAGGGKPSQCGWLKDQFGVSWQVVPYTIEKYAADPEKFEKAMSAVMRMSKLDMKKIDEAANSSSRS